MTSGDEFYPDTFVYTLLKSCVKKKIVYDSELLNMHFN